jgi:hypothetical protein
MWMLRNYRLKRNWLILLFIIVGIVQSSTLWFPRNNDVFTPICFVKNSNLTCYLYLLTVTFFQHYFYVRWCSWPLAGTRWDPPVEQKLHTLPEHLKQPRVFMLGSFANFVRFLASLILLTNKDLHLLILYI